MEEKLSDQQLIKNFASGDRTAADDLYSKYKEKIFSIAYKYSKNVDAAEEIVQDTFLKAFQVLNELKEKNNFGAWISKIAKNKSIDYSRKVKRDEKIGIKIKDSNIPEETEAYQIWQVVKTDEGIEQKFIEYEDLSRIEFLKFSDSQFLKELKRSLDYILHIYWLKEEYDFKQKNVFPFIRARTILIETKTAIENLFGPPSKKNVIETYRILRPGFSEDDKKYMDNIFNEPIHHLMKLHHLREPFIKNNKEKLDEVIKKHGLVLKKMLEATSLPKKLDRSINQLFFWEDNKEFFNLSNQYLRKLIKKMEEQISKRSSFSWFLLPDNLKKMLGNIDKINVEPPVLIFRVWTKAFRENKKTNLKFIRDLMLEFKKQYKKTFWAPLFDPLNESFNVETWRRKILRSSGNNDFYDKLSDLIYRMSFIEKIPIYPWR